MNRKTARIISQFLAFSFLLTLLVTPTFAAEATPREQSAGQAVALVQEVSGAASVQYALMEIGKPTLTGQAGVYSRNENRALTTDNLYGIGSVSKMYTTVAVMKLVEDGLVNLDAPVTRYIPTFKMADERYKQITVRMLLNHSSGLYGSTMADSFTFASKDTVLMDNFLARLATQTLKADPGAYSVYCNDGFTLAEILVETVSKQSFTTFLHERILAPLNLSGTFTPQDDFDTELLAKTYYTPDNVDALPYETLGVIGAGGVYATAEDLAQFGSLFYTGTVLTAASSKLTQSPEYDRGLWPKDEDHSLTYGLGWDNVELFPFTQKNITALVKGGDTLNYHSSLIVLPEFGMAAAVVSSGGASTYNQMLAARLLIDALGERGIVVDETIPDLPAAAPAALPESELAKAGTYGSSLQSLHVSLTKEGIMTFAEIPGLDLQYHSDGSYRDGENSMLFRLVEEENGEIYLWQKAYGKVSMLPPVVTALYAAQKLPDNEVSDEVWEKWLENNGKLFLTSSETYTSQIYLAQPMTAFPVTQSADGYLLNRRIVDAAHLAPVGQIPGMMGRDWQDMSLKTIEGKLYLEVGGYLMISSDDVPAIYGGAKSRCTIQADGYARWYAIGEAAGKQMTVTMPDQGVFYVYDATGVVVASSIWQDTGAELPADGWIVFAGKIGQQFWVEMVNED